MASKALAYDFEYFEGTSARQSRYLEPVHPAAKRQDAVAAPRRKTKVFRTTFFLLLCLSAAIIMLYSNVQINETNKSIDKLDKQISEIRSENHRLEMTLEQTLSAKNIEFIATTEFGMMRLETNQVEYINVSSKGFILLPSGKETLLDKILKLF